VNAVPMDADYTPRYIRIVAVAALAGIMWLPGSTGFRLLPG
jgi:hypothetical protein